MRTISTFPFNIKSFYLIMRGIVYGILSNRSTSTNITSMISSAITRGRMAGLKGPMSTTSNINWVSVAGLKIPMSSSLITPKTLQCLLICKFHCYYDGGRNNRWSHDINIIDFHHHPFWKTVDPLIQFVPLSWCDEWLQGNELCQDLGINYFRYQVLMISGTGRLGWVCIYDWNATRWSSYCWFCGIAALVGYINKFKNSK